MNAKEAVAKEEVMANAVAEAIGMDKDKAWMGSLGTKKDKSVKPRVLQPSKSAAKEQTTSLVFRPDYTTPKDPEQIRRFINSCLLNLSNHHRIDTSGLVTAMASSEGQARLRDIMVMPMGIEAAHSRERLSFQFVILPLIGVLTRESVCESTMSNESNTIYATVYAHRQTFIKNGIIPSMQRLLARGSLADRSPAATKIQQEEEYMCVVTSMPCAVLAVARLLYQIITRIHDAHTDLAPYVKKLTKSVETSAMASMGAERERIVHEIMVKELDRLQRIVSDAEDAVIPPLEVIITDPAARSHSVPTKTQLRTAFDYPGMLSTSGPMHDNDRAQISEIEILPTQQEITCSRPPFLPYNGIPDAPHFLAPGWKRQIDTHFRLNREDMMDPFRRSIMSFLALLRHTPFGEEALLLDDKELRKVIADHISLNVYGNIQVFGMATEIKTAGNIEIGFSQPLQILGTESERQRFEFWERSKNRLMHGGLVCLVYRDQGALDSGQGTSKMDIQLVQAVIARRDIESLASDDKVARISITLADPLQYLLLLNLASEISSKHWFLVESPGAHFGSYRPILKALQHIIPASLPFGKYLAPTTEEQAKIEKAKKPVDPPIYARAPTFQYDLSVLLEGQKCRLDVNSTISIEKSIRTLQTNSTLDDTQVKALVETLGREVALIHAPPGTGRTSIGLALVEVLRANKALSKCGPILYICSTDGALDRFLEQCLDKGVLDIARIGAGSKLKRMEQYSLETLLGGHTRPYQYQLERALEMVTNDVESNIKRIRDLERELRGECVEWRHIPSTNRSVDLLLDSDIWNMSMNERKRLLDHWRPKVQGQLLVQLVALVKYVKSFSDAKNGAFDELRRDILHNRSVVGMTVNGAIESQELIQKLAPKIIIYEEASQVLESHILATLSPSTQHLILIGDHMQLRPQIETYNLSSDSPIGKKYNLDMSLFERLATLVTNPFPMSVLTTQRRMQPSIADLIRRPLYPGLLNGRPVYEYPPVCGIAEELFFMHHDRQQNGKIVNGVQLYPSTFEAEMVKALATYLIMNGYDHPGDIAIFTPHLCQLSVLYDTLKSTFTIILTERDRAQLDQITLEESSNGRDSVYTQVLIPIKKGPLTLCTPDSYEGEEARIVIISMAQSKDDNSTPAPGKARFLKSPNRTNFLLSRAKHGMFIIGNADLLEREKNGIWPSVIKDLRAHGWVGAGFPLKCKNHPEQIRIVESAEQLKNGDWAA
ncbi:hypothetical protein BG003_008298 [Podila horticola]|nr:hypothetical protein BG003_008298 [Podila horticola]